MLFFAAIFAAMKCHKKSPIWLRIFSWTPQLKQEASIGRRLAFTICLFILTLQFGYLCYFGEVWILYFTNWKLILCLLWLYNSNQQTLSASRKSLSVECYSHSIHESILFTYIFLIYVTKLASENTLLIPYNLQPNKNQFYAKKRKTIDLEPAL